jgi:4-amino-4-deoxy-L-arabinose transferase-like glycosyltransferase
MSAITYPLTRERPASLRARLAMIGWARPSFIALLAVTLLLYVWGLDRNGWANAYYSAAVEAGTKSWTAFLFGSLDASNFITVDKSPAFLWVMDISARVFGVNTWSIQVPQALEGVATVGLTYAMVRRWFGPHSALIAGAVVALTPVAALMFRFNNPDALLVLLVTGAVYATLRAVETARTGWLLFAAFLVGTGFLAKMLQAFLVVPVAAFVYLAFGAPRLRRRVAQLFAAGIALLVSSGWWVALVELWPAASRPYIGGSQTNSVIELILGYNGLGRITGNEAGSVVAAAAGTVSQWGPTGWNRLFNSDFGGQASWLIPAVLVLSAAGLVYTFARPRTDIRRAALVMFAGWLLLTGLVFSFAQGIIHPYYTIALAPPIGALAGAGGWLVWQRRSSLGARLVMSLALVATVVWADALLDRSPSWHPELRVAVMAVGLPVAVLIVVAPLVWRRGLGVIAAAAVMVALAAPAAYTLETVTTAHSGAIPSAGPAVAMSAGFGPGGGRFAGGPPGANGFTPPAGARPPLRPFAGGATPGGGFLSAAQVGSQMKSLLQSGASRYEWVAATIDANSAAGYELATGEPVMAIGGFNGSDPAPTLTEFQALVAQGKIHYFIGTGGGMASGSTANSIAAWVSGHFTATTVDGVTVYDLTQPVSS